MGLGRWDAGAVHAAQAARLDPRDAASLANLCSVEVWRHYAEARTACASALALRPDNMAYVESTVLLALAQGDLTGARRAIHDVPPSVDEASVLAYLSEYWDLYVVLDSAQQARLLAVGADAFDGDAATRAIVFARSSP